MVTATMKAELKDRLGYEASDIRKLTPVQASLILQHDVTPADQSTRLAILVQAHHDAVEQEANRQREIGDREREEEDERVRVLRENQQQQKQEERELQQEQEQPPEQVASTSASAQLDVDAQVPSEGNVEQEQILSIGTGISSSGTSSTNSSGTSTAAETPITDSVPSAGAETESTPPPAAVMKDAPKFGRSSNTLLHQDKGLDEHKPGTSVTRGTVWYEIVENTHTNGLVKDDNDNEDDVKSIVGSAKIGTEVVALYKSQEEAELGLETKRLFALRLAKDRGLPEATSTFEVRQVLKD
jgi:hypothetical protein